MCQGHLKITFKKGIAPFNHFRSCQRPCTKKRINGGKGLNFFVRVCDLDMFVVFESSEDWWDKSEFWPTIYCLV